MRPDHYPAAIAQLISAFLIFCLLANALSIRADAHCRRRDESIGRQDRAVAPSTLVSFCYADHLHSRTAADRRRTLLNELDILRGWPVSLVLSLMILFITTLIYRKLITVEGEWLSAREKKVLEIVTSKSD